MEFEKRFASSSESIEMRCTESTIRNLKEICVVSLSAVIASVINASSHLNRIMDKSVTNAIDYSDVLLYNNFLANSIMPIHFHYLILIHLH